MNKTSSLKTIDMGKWKYSIFALCAINIFAFIACEDSSKDLNPDFEYLKGTWVDNESFAMQFVDFYSENQANFGMYSRTFERYDSFQYRITESNQIVIDFLGDTESRETFHNLIKIGNDTIEISDLTTIPENPNKVYIRREIITEKQNDTIIIGHNQIYYDPEYDFKLEMVSVLSDSRCPSGVDCVWEGNAEVRFDLIIGGNYQHDFVLNTNQEFQTDTLIDKITYRLVGLVPYPKINQSIDIKDYKAKIIIEEQ